MSRRTKNNRPLPAPSASVVGVPPAAMSSHGGLLTENELALRWKLASAKKLQADRVKGVGCPFVRIGRCVRYRLSDVLAHEAANLRQSTGEG